MAPEVRALWANREDVGAWARVAMMLGDAHAPALCYAVARHALGLCEAGDPLRGRLSGHAALAALDLGFATHEDGQTQFDPEAERQFLDVTFAEVGDLEQSALLSLCVLADKLGLIVGPEAPTLTDYRDPSRWTLAPVTSRDTLVD